ncbi:MAG: 50S ribosomal protein L11 methyltransferase [Bryobacteraceae bacterium]|jgi:ribosomal protein L11 methyltransferase
MFSFVLTCSESEAEFLCAELWEKGAAGIEETALPGGRCQLRAYFENPEGLAEAFAAFQPRPEPVPDVDWEAVWRQAWQPFPVGRRLYLAPEWDESPTPPGRHRLVVHPGQALGTGAHPATRLCLEALDSRLEPGQAVLDVGTGSGILASAALLLGARAAAACDIDFGALLIARRNLLSDGRRAALFCGSARAVRPRAFDAVVANINAATHASLAAEYERLAPSLLILAGFTVRDLPELEPLLRRHGFHPEAVLESEEWRCLVLCNAVRS